MMVAESEDGLHFEPSPRPERVPVGGKTAPQHIFTLPDGSCGGVYHDPIAADGYPFKIYADQKGQAVLERAKKNPNHRWHGIEEQKPSTGFIPRGTDHERQGALWGSALSTLRFA